MLLEIALISIAFCGEAVTGLGVGGSGFGAVVDAGSSGNIFFLFWRSLYV